MGDAGARGESGSGGPKGRDGITGQDGTRGEDGEQVIISFGLTMLDHAVTILTFSRSALVMSNILRCYNNIKKNVCRVPLCDL